MNKCVAQQDAVNGIRMQKRERPSTLFAGWLSYKGAETIRVDVQIFGNRIFMLSWESALAMGEKLFNGKTDIFDNLPKEEG